MLSPSIDLYFSCICSLKKNLFFSTCFLFCPVACLIPQWPITCGTIALSWATGSKELLLLPLKYWKVGEISYLSQSESLWLQRRPFSHLEMKNHWNLNQFMNCLSFPDSLFKSKEILILNKTQQRYRLHPVLLSQLPLLSNNWIFKVLITVINLCLLR